MKATEPAIKANLNLANSLVFCSLNTNVEDMHYCGSLFEPYNFSFPFLKLLALEDTNYCGCESNVKKVDSSFQITGKHLHLILQSRFPII